MSAYGLAFGNNFGRPGTSSFSSRAAGRALGKRFRSAKYGLRVPVASESLARATLLSSKLISPAARAEGSYLRCADERGAPDSGSEIVCTNWREGIPGSSIGL